MKRSRVTIVATIGGVVIALPAQAQIVPDAPSEISGSGTDLAIVGGTQAGSNLFHSFTEFNIGADKRVSFEAATGVTDIFARVTGSNISAIEGTLSSGANLFLLNPNGISWGATARADVAGALTLSAADSVLFADGSRWDLDTLPDRQLLTISAPIGLGLADGGLSITGELAVPAGETLRLAGADIAIARAQVSAPGGRLDLAAGSGDWDLEAGFDSRGLTGAIDVRGAIVSTAGAGGGRLNVAGDRVAIAAGSALIADTLGNLDGQGLTVTANELSVTDGSFLSSLTFGGGDAGDMRLTISDRLFVSGVGYETLQQVYIGGALTGQLTPEARFGGIFAGTASSGDGGRVSIETGQVEFRDGGILVTSTFGSGASGSVTIAARDSIALAGAGISALGAFGSSGTMGSVEVTAPIVALLDGGLISSTTFSPQAGSDVTLRSSDVLLSGTPDGALVPGGILSNTIGSTGAAGDINLYTDRLIIEGNTELVSQSGASLEDFVFDVGGNGGTLRVEAKDAIEIRGGAPSGFDSGLTSATFSGSPAGNIEISTARLSLSGEALISAATRGSGTGGTVTIVASERIDAVGELSDSGRSAEITASSGGFQFPNATGTGGNVSIAAPDLNLETRSIVRVSGSSLGDAGTLTIDSDRLTLNDARIEASSRVGFGGNIEIGSQDMRLRDGATISTDSLSTNGGNISIVADTLVALENSDITANALRGFGGQVTIAADGVFGTELRISLTPDSDVTATSALGSRFLGVVELNAPDVGDARVHLGADEAQAAEPLALVDRCATNARDSVFIVTSRLSNPHAIGQERAVRFPLVAPETGSLAGLDRDRLSPQRTVAEATGWIGINRSIVLVGQVSPLSATLQSCQTARENLGNT